VDGSQEGSPLNAIALRGDPSWERAGTPAAAQHYLAEHAVRAGDNLWTFLHHQAISLSGMAEKLSRRQASDAVTGLGWRYVLGTLRTSVRASSLAQAAEVATRAVGVDGSDGHLSVDIRRDRVILTLQTATTATVTPPDVELARQISQRVNEIGLQTDGHGPQPVQALEIAIDALDIPAIRPFWKSVMEYEDEVPGSHGLVDPAGQGPAIWFQQMDVPRPQRNRIHIDISVPHDEAEHRIQAALAAGGKLVSDAAAPAFWVLADPEGNEACITTWQGRD
jgi:4a-hydroxytetrahydrobiopterin dehydratase